MKKFLTIIIASLGIVTARGEMELLLDCNGKEDVQGYALRDWLMNLDNNTLFVHQRIGIDVRPADSIMAKVIFRERAAALINWEIRKYLKRKVFALGYFSHPDDELIFFRIYDYLTQYPSVADKEMANLLYLNYIKNSAGFGIQSENNKKALLAMGDMGHRLLASGNRPSPSSIPSGRLEEAIGNKGPQDIEKFRRENYEKAFALFLQRTSCDPMDKLDLLNYYPLEKVVDDMIKRRVISPRNIIPFCAYVKAFPVIPDAVALEVVKNLAAEPPAAQVQTLRVFLFYLLGKNRIIDQYASDHVDRIFPDPGKMKSFSGEYFYLKHKSPQDVLEYMKQQSISAIDNPLSRYATLTGKFNEMTDVIRALYDWYNKAYTGDDRMRVANDGMIWAKAYDMLKVSSSLTPENRRFLFDKFMHYPPFMVTINTRYLGYVPLAAENAPLLEPRYFTDPQTRNTALNLVTELPFDRLPPESRKITLAYYLSQLNPSAYDPRGLQPLKILEIRDAQVRQQIFDALFDTLKIPGNKNRVLCRKMLEAEGSVFIPYLLKRARSEDPVYAVTACEIIGASSLFARSFALELEAIVADPAQDFSVRIAAICALAESGATDAIPFLEKYVTDPNKMIARAARQALLLLNPVDDINRLPPQVLSAEVQKVLEQKKL